MPRRRQPPPQVIIDDPVQHPITAMDVQVRLPIRTVLLLACKAACSNTTFEDACEIAVRGFIQPTVEQTIAHIIRTTPVPTFPLPHIPTFRAEDAPPEEVALTR